MTDDNDNANSLDDDNGARDLGGNLDDVCDGNPDGSSTPMVIKILIA